MYKPVYNNSHALVVGINGYKKVSPLEYAISDAEVIASHLVDDFGFPPDNIIRLFDNDATKENVLKEYLRFTKDLIEPDDRLIVFYAGHGHTEHGKRGEVGFLVPVDGSPDDLSTLIRWDELSRYSDLIPAKHILYIMDACYGGLILERTSATGTVRFLKDMLKRYSRQVLTAGKADETVSDSGGPIPNHSVFTGHLINALKGGAVSEDGTITANNVMTYVYNKVAKDQYSKQTPHYGYLDGDGDFIFSAPKLAELLEDLETDDDVLIEIAPSERINDSNKASKSFLDLTKEYLAEPKYIIKLNDLVMEELRRLMNTLNEESFPVDRNKAGDETYIDRLKSYEDAVSNLQKVTILICRWGASEHLNILENIFNRITDTITSKNGDVGFLELRWHPCALLMYSAGISAICAKSYDKLKVIFDLVVHKSHRYDVEPLLIQALIDSFADLERIDLFKSISGHEHHYVPRSEYFYKILQPTIEDMLYVGKSYESIYDKYEIIFSLAYIDSKEDIKGSEWAPLGRFAWKHRQLRISGSPFNDIVKEAHKFGESWPPLRAGLFGGTIERFDEIALSYKGFLDKLPWM